MLKLFYILTLIWLLVLVYSDFISGFRGAAALLIFLLAAAVFGISERISRAVRQIQDRSFDPKAEDKREWRFVTGISLLACSALLVGTLGQGVWQCTQDGGKLSAQCVWNGMVDKPTAQHFDPAKTRTGNSPAAT